MTARVVAGVWVMTPAEVYLHYRPRPDFISEAVWQQVRPVAVTACEATSHASVDAALGAIRAVAQFLAWCTRQEMPLEAERVFRPEHVERFVATQTSHMTAASRATLRGHLRRVARAATKSAPWSQPERAYVRATSMSVPLADHDVNLYWEALRAQPSPLWERRLKALMVLGLGAGLPRREALLVSIREHVRQSTVDPDLWVLQLPDRTVPIDTRYVPLLKELARQDHTEPLVGPYRADAKNPMAVLTEGIVLPPGLPPVRLARFRITWMKRLLERDVRISEFQAMAGIASAKTLETIAPFIDLRRDGAEWLRKGAGL